MIRICKYCGTSLDMQATRCTECGKPVFDYDEMNEEEISQEEGHLLEELPIVEETNGTEKQTSSNKGFSVKGTKFEPISTAGYLGIIFLLAIPVVGLIFAVKWAMGGCRKVQKKFFARAALILMTINMIFTIAGVITVKTVIDTALEEVGMEWSDLTSLYGIFDMADMMSYYEEDMYYDEDYDDSDYYYDEYEDETESYGLISKLAVLAEDYGLTLEDLANMESLDELMEYLGYSDASQTVTDSSSEAESAAPSSQESSSVPASSEQSSSAPVPGSTSPSTVPSSSADISGSQATSEATQSTSNEADWDSSDYEASDGEWPRNIREYTHGIKTDISPNYLEISDTNRQEMIKYIDQLKKDGYKYLDFYEYDMTEKEMLEIDEWCGTNGKIFINVYNYDDIVIIEYMDETP